MRGSHANILTEICKVIYEPELSKIEQKKEGLLANAHTVETYKNIWDEIIQFVLVECKIKDFQAIESQHIESYFSQKLQTGITIQYAELISSAIGKLEIALKKLAQKFHNHHKYVEYDFSIRFKLLKEAKEANMLKKGSKVKYYSRAYANPCALINALTHPWFRLAATIQFEGGARVSAVEKIYPLRQIKPHKLIDNKLTNIEIVKESPKHVFVKQLQGIQPDFYTKEKVGYLLTVEKGGKPGLVRISIDTYELLEMYLEENGSFEIAYDAYIDALKEAAEKTHQTYNGSHGLRWNYAQNRIVELQEYGYSYAQSEQIVSWEMKHNRASITQHYIGH